MKYRFCSVQKILPGKARAIMETKKVLDNVQ